MKSNRRQFISTAAMASLSIPLLGMKEAILQDDKLKLLNSAMDLEKQRKRLYSHMPIESPKSIEEKQLEKEIANIYSDINNIVIQIRKLRDI